MTSPTASDRAPRSTAIVDGLDATYVDTDGQPVAAPGPAVLHVGLELVDVDVHVAFDTVGLPSGLCRVGPAVVLTVAGARHLVLGRRRVHSPDSQLDVAVSLSLDGYVAGTARHAVSLRQPERTAAGSASLSLAMISRRATYATGVAADLAGLGSVRVQIERTRREVVPGHVADAEQDTAPS